jgi:hypothetical protein
VLPEDDHFSIETIPYLLSKNSVDDLSISKDIFNRISSSVLEMRRSRSRRMRLNHTLTNPLVLTSLVVLDLGSGLLNMLRSVLLIANNLVEKGDKFK